MVCFIFEYKFASMFNTLPFVDVPLIQDNYELKVKVYWEPANKNNLINFHSHQCKSSFDIIFLVYISQFSWRHKGHHGYSFK